MIEKAVYGGYGLARGGDGGVVIVRGALPGEVVDAVVADPPRIGLSERAVRLLEGIRAARILYVSCDPATLARDVSRLAGVYRIGGIESYDFFPQTHHVETLAVLERSQ